MKMLYPSAALAAALLVAPVSAQAAPRAQTVRIADLDLASPRGIARLDRRIHRAAVTVCTPGTQLDLHGRNAVSRCVADTKTAAIPARTHAIAARTPDTAVLVAAR